MDGENNGKPYSNEWLGGGTIIFGNTHITKSFRYQHGEDSSILGTSEMFVE